MNEINSEYLSENLLEIMRKNNFMLWLSKTYPDIKLTTDQELIAKFIFNHGRSAGMSFIINLIKEFDDYKDGRE